MIKLVIGLGNPGSEYELTRHNIGWLVLDNLSFSSSLFWKSKFKGEYADTTYEGEKRYFLKPHTYMNLSGESAIPLMKFFKIHPKEVLVLHDELDLDFGQVNFKFGGGLAGHNGLKSLAQHLGTKDFYRLRLGIGRPDRGSVSDWVLSPFRGEDESFLGPYLTEAAKLVEYALDKGPEISIKRIGKKKII